MLLIVNTTIGFLKYGTCDLVNSEGSKMCDVKLKDAGVVVLGERNFLLRSRSE